MKEVRPPKRPLIFYYCVAVLILLLFNFLAMPWLAQRQIQEVDYNTFVEMLEDGQVGLVQLQEQENRVCLRIRRRRPSIRPPWLETRI